MHKFTGVFAVIVMCFTNVYIAHAEPVDYLGFDQSNDNSSTGSYVYTTTAVDPHRRSRTAFGGGPLRPGGNGSVDVRGSPGAPVPSGVSVCVS
jgi:hypothetical protein